MRIRLDIAYDGTHFRGWARQPGLRTVQETLESALARVLGGDPRLVVAGRTDAGVHASGQVAHVDLDVGQQRRLRSQRGRDAASEPVAALAARTRGVVGAYSDVAVHRTSSAPDGFDARFSAVWRRYSYRIADLSTGYDPLERHRTTNVRAQLDEQTMDAAARSLIGLHDFAAYCKPRDEATTIRTLLEFDWHRDAEGVAGREHQGRCVLPQHGARARRRVRRGRARAGSMSRTSSTSVTRASARTTSRCSPRADSPSPRSATRPTSCSASGRSAPARAGTVSECCA